MNEGALAPVYRFGLGVHRLPMGIICIPDTHGGEGARELRVSRLRVLIYSVQSSQLHGLNTYAGGRENTQSGSLPPRVRSVSVARLNARTTP